MAKPDEGGEVRLQQQVHTVDSIRLIGSPAVLILDPPATRSPDGAIPPGLLAKLQVLATAGNLRVIVLSAEQNCQPDTQLVPDLSVIPPDRAATIPGPALAIVTESVALPPNTIAWYVGSDSAPPSFHRTRFNNAVATNSILGLYGTALVQERAGIAFRAAGAGKAIPKDAPFDPAILNGIARVVAPPAPVHPADSSLIDIDHQTDSLIEAALQPILSCQAASGAVAAAPRPSEPGEPDYWFFWQRDAAQVILALVHLERAIGDPAIRSRCRTFIDGYLEFVERLPRFPWMEPGDLGVSRFDMDGHPIRSYGNPQNDGPAQTVLAVLAALADDEARAHRIVTPYLDYLVEWIESPSFDPWEFATGALFFDYNLARRALVAGCSLAARQDDHAASRRYFRAADALAGQLASFNSVRGGYIRAGHDYLQPFINTISGLDSSVISSILTAFNLADSVINVDSEAVIATIRALEDVYADRWPVNIAWREAGHTGMGIGRFPEDSNDGYGSTGGNPWTFTTLWAAQYYLQLVARYRHLGRHDTREDELFAKADGYLQFVLDHVSPSSMTEQIDGQSGKPRGARQLAWAQAALIDTLLIRRDLRRKMPLSTPDPTPPGSR